MSGYAPGLIKPPVPYVHQEYPKWVHGVICDNAEMEAEARATLAKHEIAQPAKVRK